MADVTHTWENVYVFISSTFNDMHAERDYLVKRVFPELSEWCETRKLRLVDIDLRWGVTEKDSQENKRVVEVCLTNIDRCRPLFLCFLGQRRGWVPERGDISEATFESFPKLDEYLGSSVTEMEITHALIDPMLNGSVLELKNRERAFFFLRDPSYLDSIDNQDIRNIYTNEAETNPVVADYQLEELKERVRETGRPTFDYIAAWNNGASTPELLAPGKPAGIDQGRLTDFRCDNRALSDVVIDCIKAALKELYPDRTPAATATPLQRELDEQARFLQFAQEGFIERVGDFDEVERFIESDDSRPCAIVAPAGMGKTSYLARLVDRLQNSDVRDVMFRFVGTSEESVSQGSLLASLASELSSRFGVKNVPASPQKIKEMLPTLLAEAATEAPLVVIVDAINQLDTSLDDLSWIPTVLPDDVTFIYSFKLGETAGDTLCRTLQDLGETYVVRLTGFHDATDRSALVSQYLSLYLKELDEGNIDDIISSEGAENPLFLKVLLSELRVFGSHERLHDMIVGQFGTTPQTAFDGMLERLETDPMYSTVTAHDLTANLFGWLSHAKNGLEPRELVGLFVRAGIAADSDARDSVNLMLRQLRAFLAHRDKRQDFFYESFLLAARDRYAQPAHGGKPDDEWHRELAEYFQSLDDGDARKTFELAYQYAHAGMDEALVALLTSFEYLERRIRLSGVNELVWDYALADLPQAGVSKDEQQQLGLIREALEMATSMIAKRPTQLAIQLFGRLMGFDMPLVQALLKDAERTLYERKEPWLKPLYAHLPQPGSRIVRYFKTLNTNGAWLCRDGKRMVVYADVDKTVKIIEVETGRVLRSFPLRDRPMWTRLFEDENVLAVREMNKLYFLNLATGQTYAAEGIEGMNGFVFDAWENMLVCTGHNRDSVEKTVYVTDARTGSLLHKLSFIDGPPESGTMNAFAVSFDHDTGLLIMSVEEAGFTAYDPHDGFRVVRRYRNTDSESSASSFKSNQLLSPEGTRFLITVTAYDGLNIYDKHTGQVLAHESLFGLNAHLAVSADGSTLAYSSPISVRLYSLTAFQTIGEIKLGNSRNGVALLAFSPDGKSLYLGRENGAIEVWDIDTLQVADRFDDAKESPLELHFNVPDGLMLAFHKNQVIIWDQSKASVVSDSTVFDLPFSSLALLPDGSFLLATTESSDGAIYRIDIPSMACRQLVESNGKYLSYDNIILSPDGRHFGVTERFDKYHLFTCDTGEHVGTIEAVDALHSGDEDSRRISNAQFLPASLSQGPRNLTILYRQYGYLVVQDPDAPGQERVIHAFPGSVGTMRLFDSQSKLMALSSTYAFDASAGKLKSRNDPALEDGAKVFDLASGECLEHSDEWPRLYAKSLELDDYPDIVKAIIESCKTEEGGKRFIRFAPRPICCQEGRLVYAYAPGYVPGIRDSWREHVFIVWDSTRKDPLCWYCSDASVAFTNELFSPDGKHAFMLAGATLLAFSLENVLEMKPAPAPLRSEQELDHLGVVLFEKGDMESMHESYLVYSELVERFPEKEHHAKNRSIMERKLKMLLDEMSKANDVAGIKRYYDRYRMLANEHPGDKSYLALLNYAQGKLAFRLSIRDDLASKERACGLYGELVERHYDEERNQKNLDITLAQITALQST